MVLQGQVPRRGEVRAEGSHNLVGELGRGRRRLREEGGPGASLAVPGPWGPALLSAAEWVAPEG